MMQACVPDDRCSSWTSPCPCGRCQVTLGGTQDGMQPTRLPFTSTSRARDDVSTLRWSSGERGGQMRNVRPSPSARLLAISPTFERHGDTHSLPSKFRARPCQSASGVIASPRASSGGDGPLVSVINTKIRWEGGKFAASRWRTAGRADAMKRARSTRTLSVWASRGGVTTCCSRRGRGFARRGATKREGRHATSSPPPGEVDSAHVEGPPADSRWRCRESRANTSVCAQSPCLANHARVRDDVVARGEDCQRSCWRRRSSEGAAGLPRCAAIVAPHLTAARAEARRTAAALAISAILVSTPPVLIPGFLAGALRQLDHMGAADRITQLFCRACGPLVFLFKYVLATSPFGILAGAQARVMPDCIGEEAAEVASLAPRSAPRALIP